MKVTKSRKTSLNKVKALLTLVLLAGAVTISPIHAKAELVPEEVEREGKPGIEDLSDDEKEKIKTDNKDDNNTQDGNADVNNDKGGTPETNNNNNDDNKKTNPSNPTDGNYNPYKDPNIKNPEDYKPPKEVDEWNKKNPDTPVPKTGDDYSEETAAKVLLATILSGGVAYTIITSRRAYNKNISREKKLVKKLEEMDK